MARSFCLGCLDFRALPFNAGWLGCLPVAYGHWHIHLIISHLHTLRQLEPLLLMLQAIALECKRVLTRSKSWPPNSRSTVLCGLSDSSPPQLPEFNSSAGHVPRSQKSLDQSFVAQCLTALATAPCPETASKEAIQRAIQRATRQCAERERER